jgi:hypothetical protein
MVWIGLAICGVLVFILWTVLVVGKRADEQMERMKRK